MKFFHLHCMRKDFNYLCHLSKHWGMIKYASIFSCLSKHLQHDKGLLEFKMTALCTCTHSKLLASFLEEGEIQGNNGIQVTFGNPGNQILSNVPHPNSCNKTWWQFIEDIILNQRASEANLALAKILLNSALGENLRVYHLTHCGLATA